jgi:hypothetical protein
MQVIENWTCVTGKVLEQAPPATDGHHEIVISVEKTAEVANFPNLLRAGKGDHLTVRIPAAVKLPATGLTGCTITLPVRAVRRDSYAAHAEWSLQNGSPLCR